MSENINYSYITDYLRSLLKKREGLIDEIEKEAAKEESYVPIAEPETAQFIRVLLDIHKPSKILEIGTGCAYSAICMASHSDVKIKTIERYDKVYARAVENIKKAGLEDKIEPILGDAIDILSEMDSEEYDMVFLDAAKGQYINFLPHIMRNLKKGGLLVSDNVLYKGMVAERSLFVRRKVTIIKRLKMYLKELSENEAFDTTIVPIGDGVALSYKKI